MRMRPGLAIDLGTVNTLVHVAGRGIVVDEPSAVALDGAGRAVAIGAAADAISGKAPEGTEVVWPLRDGVVADIEAVILMLNGFLRRAHVHRGLMRPTAVLCVPRGATSFERQAVEAAVRALSPHCGLRMIEEPVAAAVGAGMTAPGTAGAFVVDIGGGTTEVAAVAGGGVVRARSLRVAGNSMDAAIARAVRSELGLSLGHRSAERLKIGLGLTGGESAAEVAAVDAASGALRTARVPGSLVAAAIEPAVRAIVEVVGEVLSETPPDLAADVVGGKIQLAGGGALLPGLAERVEGSTGIATTVADDPLRCVVRGAAAILQHGNGHWASMAAA